jgi:hypothetical protein
MHAFKKRHTFYGNDFDETSVERPYFKIYAYIEFYTNRTESVESTDQVLYMLLSQMYCINFQKCQLPKTVREDLLY